MKKRLFSMIVAIAMVMTFLPLNGYAEAIKAAAGDLPEVDQNTAEERLALFNSLNNIQVATGDNHCVVLKENGSVWTWGKNSNGQLGDGTTIENGIPKQVAGLTNIKAVAAGDNHTAALKEDGSVWAWGDNTKGQLGDGTNTDHSIPVIVNGLTDVKTIAAGGTHTIAVKTDGTVYAWGGNQYGQLGDEIKQNHNIPGIVSGLDNVKSVAAGYGHTAALKEDGSIWVWGRNFRGELGNGTTENQSIPAQVSGLADIKAIAAGRWYTAAVKEDGSVWTWGDNISGQLGYEISGEYSTIPGKIDCLTGIKAITAGASHMVALKEDGNVWTWGSNRYGQLGDRIEAANIPAAVSNLSSVKAVSAGDSYTVVLQEDGTVYTWGSTQYGQLGNGKVQFETAPVAASDLAGIKAVAAGTWFTAALSTDGVVWTWGNNFSGQLGYDTLFGSIPNCSNIPKRTQGLTDVKAIAAGTSHMTALREDGTVWTWGSNTNGESGTGTKWYNRPEQVSGLTDVKAIAAGYKNTVALKEDGTVYAWGDNAFGQLGNGTNTESNVPVAVEGLTGVKAIASDGYHTVALKEDGTVYAWGSNAAGSLGDGTWNNRSTPVQVSGLTDVKALAAGFAHTVALKENGDVYTWGWNLDGPYGIESTNNDTPVKVSNLAGVKAVEAGDSHTVVLKEDGTVYAWGLNQYGQLGDGTTTSHSTPEMVSGLSNVKAIATQRDHTAAVKEDGTVCGWGTNSFGELGDERIFSINIPYKIEGSVNILYNNNIESMVAPNPVNVAEGTESPALPETVEVILDDSRKVNVEVIWDISDYDANQIGEQTIPGALALPGGMTNSQNLEPEIKVTVYAVPHDIISVAAINPVTVDFGTPVEELQLPGQVTVILDNDRNRPLSVIWDKSNYNPTQSGEIILTGEIQLVEGITNTRNYLAEVMVVVNDPPKTRITSLASKQITADQGLPLGVGTKIHAIGGAATTVDVPQTVTATLEDERDVELNVTWDDTNYKPYQIGEQTISGKLELDDTNIINPSEYMAELKITVVPTQYEVLTINPETISVDVLGGTSKNKVYELLTPKTIDIEAMNSETAEIVYLYSDYTLSDDYPENVNYDANQLGAQTLIGRFNSAITDTFMPPYVEINVNVVASSIANVPSVQMDAYQSLDFADNADIPQQVTVETENGMTAQVGVEWNTGNYQKDLAGDQIITGRLVNLPSGVLQADPEKIATLIVHVKPVSFKITSVISDILDTEMDAGYTLAEVQQKLPVQTAKVQLESTNLEEPISIEYDMPFALKEENNPDYDPTVATLYVLTGTFGLPANILNPDQYVYEIFLMTLPVGIKSIEPAYVTTTMGTDFVEIEKPAQVCLTLENGKQQWVDVDWGIGEGYVSDSDELTEDNPIQSIVIGELCNRPDYINFAEEQAALVITVMLPRVYYINSISPARIPETGTMKVNLGSSLEEIYNSLPVHSVTVELRNLKNVVSTQEMTFILREEDNPDYDPMMESEFELKAYLNLPETVENPDDKELMISIQPTKHVVKSAVAVKIGGIILGTPFDQIGLPENAPVNYTDNTAGELPTTWSDATYSLTKLGAQAIKGTFNTPLPVYVENPNNRQPVAALTVVDPSVRILSAEPVESVLMFGLEDEEIEIPGLTMRKYRVELLHEDGSITTEVIFVFEEVEE